MILHQRIERLRQHAAHLLIVLAATTIGQIATLMQQPLSSINPDTHSYVDAAQVIVSAPSVWGKVQHLVQPFRTPGLPAILAIVAQISGQSNFTMVVLIQAAFAVATIFECYVLVARISQQRWVACIAASLIALNLYILSWERAIYTELLSYWSIVTVLLVFERFARRPRLSTAVLLALMSFVSVMIRPFNLFLLPLLMVVLALRFAWIRELRRHWKPLALSTTLFFAGVLGYMSANAYAYGFFSVSWDSNVTLVGKVMEYNMQGAYVDPQYRATQADIEHFVATHPYYPPNPWNLPSDKYNGENGYVPAGQYAENLILHNLGLFAVDSLPDVYKTWRAEPVMYQAFGVAPNGKFITDRHAVPGISAYPLFRVGAFWGGRVTTRYEPAWVNMLLIISTIEQQSYLLLPLLLLWLGWWVWRHPKDPGAFMLVVMLLVVVAGIIFAAVGNYEEFYRIRFPVDWAMIAAAVMVLAHLLSRSRRASVEGSAQTDMSLQPTLPMDGVASLSKPPLEPRAGTVVSSAHAADRTVPLAGSAWLLWRETSALDGAALKDEAHGRPGDERTNGSA